MLLRGLTALVAFQLLGSALHALCLAALPGPIIGLLLLFGALLCMGQVPAPISEAASGLLRYLPLLLVPPAVGIMAYGGAIAAHIWAILGALSVSVVLSLAFSGWLMGRLSARRQP
ncbi:CidA/LrgA family protein [Pseudomonas typographi]|uniref:CidA/LrgA family protein n=1 Tax=Pseudomonas typographi TaxID=2715964 RepID=A0ABR7Z6A4_9PSED|nr:CidA/LrgA family protein [Pseudomonas typographi]MBD1553458.1 CidA/LrgA family protein [Pseudomonas typographi]MBD1589005.1 CidA/LrgA family protein [Pseudomonas typographi]MBD1600932.1 CidA/LrgA family protein [Pseudomonas typographi]